MLTPASADPPRSSRSVDRNAFLMVFLLVYAREA
jgi:hypothetical protein